MPHVFFLKRRMTSVFWLLCLFLFQVSCASYLLDETQEEIKDAVCDQRYSDAIISLEESKKKEIYNQINIKVFFLLNYLMLHVKFPELILRLNKILSVHNLP